MSHRTLLGLWAHPDDEAYLSAGLMYEHARRGDRVVVVTATAGEHGTTDPEAWPPRRLAAGRRAELTASLAAVGVHEHVVLDHRDGGCADVDGTDVFAAYIVAVDPDLIVTFGPDGMTGHAAHKDASAWATKALHEAGKPGSKVLYATVTPEFAAEILPVWEPFEVFRPGTPPITPRDELAVYYELPEDVLATKVDAINAHVSQVEAILEAVGPELWWKQMSIEAFRRGEERS
ncbi:MAG TPA: PIG-L family deacetylase [Actinomycetota bacterium]|nr:PIG-L family deacetylase [Actinomycetota bacterium]